MADAITIDIWVWSLAAAARDLARVAQHLNDEEAARAARFLDAAHGDYYRIGRGRMREILAGYVGAAPAALKFTEGKSGKPALIGPAPIEPGTLQFNLSHSGGLAALAVTRAPVHALGIDIERMRERGTEIAERFFSPIEVAALNALPATEQRAAFYRCWTRKEAFIKALGDGFSRPLNSFDVTLDAQAPAFIRIDGVLAADLKRWQLIHIPEASLASGIIGAVAVELSVGQLPAIVRFQDALYS